MEAIDTVLSDRWAIASKRGVSLLAAVSVFRLVNLHTGREHQADLTWLNIMWKPSAEFSSLSYNKFTTTKPVNFTNFDWAGVGIVELDAVAYSEAILSIWEGGVGVGTPLADVKSTGWGLNFPPGVGAGHGVLTITYGSGKRDGVVALELEDDDPLPPSERLTGPYRFAPSEQPIALPSDALFDFDSSRLRPDAEEVLRQAAAIITRRKPAVVSIEGHTDSIGQHAYNNKLSLARARSVKHWMVANKVPRAAGFFVKGWGEMRPIAPNTRGNGRVDDPEGRQKNRRVELVLRGMTAP